MARLSTDGVSTVKSEGVCYIAAAALAAAWIIAPARTEARQNFNIDFPDGADRCSDLKVRSSGQVAQAAESFTATKSEAPTLEVSGLEKANIRVRGWDRPDYSVEACKLAAALTQAAAGQLLKSISVTRSGGRFSASGPAAGDLEWLVVFLVRAPKGASLDLETKNGPTGVRDVSGTLKMRAASGLVRRSTTWTTPTEAASAGTSESPSSVAEAAGRARTVANARTAAEAADRFMVRSPFS